MTWDSNISNEDYLHYQQQAEYADRIAEAGYVLIAEAGEYGTVIVSQGQPPLL